MEQIHCIHFQADGNFPLFGSGPSHTFTIKILKLKSFKNNLFFEKMFFFFQNADPDPQYVRQVANWDPDPQPWSNIKEQDPDIRMIWISTFKGYRYPNDLVISITEISALIIKISLIRLARISAYSGYPHDADVIMQNNC